MWDSNAILAITAKKTGKSTAEIKKASWASMEKALNVSGIFVSEKHNRLGHQASGLKRIVTRMMFEQEEKEMLKFLQCDK